MATDVANSLSNKPTWASLYSAGRSSVKYIYIQQNAPIKPTIDLNYLWLLLQLLQPGGHGIQITTSSIRLDVVKMSPRNFILPTCNRNNEISPFSFPSPSPSLSPSLCPSPSPVPSPSPT